MGEILLKYFSHITLGVEILAAIFGLIYYTKYKNTAAKYFIYFLVYVVFMVLFGRYSHYVKNDGFLSFLDGTIFEKNYWYYTLFWTIAGPVFFAWYYSKILKNSISKKNLKTALIIFIMVSIIAILTNLKLFFTNSIPIIAVFGALLILICVFYYFMEILQSDKILTFHKSLNFYISCAILILWLIQTPLSFFNPYYRKADMDYVNLRGYINLFVIIFMYITYIVGLIVSKPEKDIHIK